VVQESEYNYGLKFKLGFIEDVLTRLSPSSLLGLLDSHIFRKDRSSKWLIF
jgi:hypothetical protein